MSIFSSRASRRSRYTKDQQQREKLRRRRQVASAIERLEDRHLLAFGIDVFANINQLGISSAPDSIVEFAGKAYFVADDGRTGSELWSSDGTLAGTEQVIDLLPGRESSQPEQLTVVGGELFFVAVDETDEFDLWKTDGTAAGTVMVFDANANGVYYPTELTASGGKLFFTAYEYNSGYELWVSDAGATTLVKDINPDQSIIDRPQELTDVNGTLFFSTYDNGYYNRELWKSDGTSAGTVMVKDIAIDTSDPLLPDPTMSSNPYHLTNVGGTLFFSAESFDEGVELWQSDGTTAGTTLVQDLSPGPDSSYPADLIAFLGDVFFSADDDLTGRQLFRSDGTTTTMVANTAGGSEPSNPNNLQVVGSELFFAAEGSVPATTITAKTPLLTAGNSIRTGTTSSIAALVTQVDPVQPDRGFVGWFAGNNIFTAEPMDAVDDGPGFVLNGKIGDPGENPGDDPVQLDTVAIDDLYITDIDSGDLADDFWEWTIYDPAAGLTNIDFSGFASGNEFDEAFEGLVFELFLNGSGTRTSFIEVNGDALDNWYGKRDGGNGGAISLTDPGGASIHTATIRMTLGLDGAPTFANGGNEAIIVNAQLTADLSPGTAILDPAGRELHKTDGTGPGTVMVKDIGLNSSSNPSNLTESGGMLFFSADEVAGTGRELWVSDGTDPGTVRLVDSRPGADAGGPLDGDPQNLVDVGGTLFFTTLDGFNDRELWTSDGTALNTNLLVNINPGTLSADISQLTEVGGLLYFVADDGINGQAVWVADPVLQTATLVADATPARTDKVTGLTAFANGVVFYNDTAGTVGGVFYYDGGTLIELALQRPIPVNLDGKLFAVGFDSNVSENVVYFAADDGTGDGLWRSNGTTTGTALIPGSQTVAPRDLVTRGDNVYFSGNYTGYGREVLYYSSSVGGATLFADINPFGDSDPDQLTVSGSRFFFTADDGTNGRELWRSTGSVPIVDLNPGSASSNPHNLTDVGGTLYYAADNGTDGVEPYAVTGGGSPVQIGNINPFGASSNPSGFRADNGTVYFSATNSTAGVLGEVFNNAGAGITGTGVSSLTGHATYPNSPDLTTVYSSFESPTNVLDNYGIRARAYLTAPVTGDYTFWIASDDNSELHLSTDTNPANTSLIANVPQWTSSREWGKFAQQQSVVQPLVQGQSYYIEALMKEGGGGDNLAVGWAGPGIPGPTVIDGQYLTAFGFTPGDQGSGTELWTTDGTAGSATLAVDLQSGSASSNPIPQASTGKRMLFSAIGTGSLDRELWSTDGTAAATRLVEDLNLGDEFGSFPSEFLQIGPDFFFVADDGLTGQELFRLQIEAPEVSSLDVGAPIGVYPPVPEIQRSTLDSITLVFGEEVELTADAIEIVNRNTATALTSLIVNPTVQDGQTVVEITFGPGPSVINRGLLNTLDDGNYQLTVFGVETSSIMTGENMAGDMVHGDEATDLFFRYFADTDGDRDVDGLDLARFGNTFRLDNTSGDYNEELDFDGDGDVDAGVELPEFAQRFRIPLNFI